MGFVVRTKDGGSREYGGTAKSNIETTGVSTGNVTLMWLLSKVTDRNGNTITYEYEEVTGNGEFYLTKIQYAGNRSVEFGYEARSDKQKLYFTGVSLNCNKRLKTISTYIGQTLIKQYQFNYTNDGYYSKLTEIIENGQNSERYNSTIIDYGNPDTFGEEYYAWLSTIREGYTPLFGDFNGDGKMDFMSFPPNNGSYSSRSNASIYLSNGSLRNVSFYKECSIPLQEANSVFLNYLLADLNGDGMMDAVNISQASNGTYRYSYYMSDGERLTYNNKGFNTNGKDAITGDFNGDGKYEILVINNKKVFNGEGTEIASGGIDSWGSIYLNILPNNRYLGDFNGNGKTDILVMNESGAWVYELYGNSFTRLTEFSTSDIKNTLFPYLGDFNGDGKTDILCQRLMQDYSSDIYILFSTGKGFVKQALSNTNINNAKVFVGDFNKDGKSDIFHLQYVNGIIKMNVGIFNGTGFTNTVYSTQLTPSDFEFPYEYGNFFLQIADFDGDGRSEFCFARNMDLYVIHSFDDMQTLLAKTITNGLGAYTTFSYAPLTNSYTCTRTTGSVSFPVSVRQYPIYVVTGMSQIASGFYDVLYYRYKNPRIHAQGKGFMGFEEIENDSYIKDRKTVTKYGYNSLYYYPYITEQKVTTLSGTDISKSVYENSYVIAGKTVAPYIKKQTNTDYSTNTTVTVECKETDLLGNPLKIETKYGSDVTETLTYTYFNSTADNLWICGIPLSTEKKTARSTTTWTEKQTVEYNSKYMPAKVVKYTGDGTKKVSEETFLYDTYGNVTSHSSKSFASANALTTLYEYTSGIYLTKITDPLSLVTVNTYNSSGLVQSVKDPRNKTATYEYDGMGRLIKTNYPDGVTSSTAFAWSSSPENSVYCVTEQTTGKPIRKTYFDALGRELRSSEVRYNGTEMHRDREYDNAGRISKESLPFKGSSASFWDTYSYDSFGRITSKNFASGKKDSCSYSGRNITAIKEGIASTRCYDAQGNMTSVTDPAGTVTYSLRPDGQPSSIVAPGNITTTFSYDVYGRRTGIADPSAGTRTFGYDAAGNINRETNADGMVKNMTYDAYNRIVTKVTPEFTTNYVYNSYGQPASETSTNGTSHTYVYDAFGRLSEDRDNGLDGKWLKKTYTYLSGNIFSIQYVSQSGTIGTEHRFYFSGHLSNIRFGNTSIWKLNGENNLGQPSSITTGTVDRTYSYNSYGVPTRRKATAINGGGQDCSYSFDVTKGNLTYRKDNLRNIQENFTYDNLNRLTGYAGATVSYDAKGNITQKSNAGTFSYQIPGKPYAISGLTPSDNASLVIPNRDQSVSYTSFDRPAEISEGNEYTVFDYNGSGKLTRMVQSPLLITIPINIINPPYPDTKDVWSYYLSDCYELDVEYVNSQGMLHNPVSTEKLYLGGDYYTAPVVCMKKGDGAWNIYYICRDYLGSITHIIDKNNTVVQELSYDAWGNLRNPVTQKVYEPGEAPELFLGRGYTGHVYLPKFGLINMNARLYDPVVGRFLSPDPYVQMPDFSQSFNRYSYCLNNPFKYTDPSGEKLWHWLLGAALLDPVSAITAATVTAGSFTAGATATAAMMFPMTNQGYEFQKYISPIAVMPTTILSNEQQGFGLDISVGFTKTFPVSYRVHGGFTLLLNDYDNSYSGLQTRYGSEWTFGGVISYSGTRFDSGETSQITHKLTLGIPLGSMEYENDLAVVDWLPGILKYDEGDRFRTAAASINMGLFSINTNLFTGDPGQDRGIENIGYTLINGHNTYIANNGYDPNKYRAGVLSFGFGPFRFGRNSEGIRKAFQNQFAHDFLTGGQSKWFRVLPIQPSWYWYFGTGTGNTLW
jgi:RHS repeat-associated protein